MGTLFGTDGIRGVAGEPPLDANTVYRTGYCLAEHLKELDTRPHIFIARDTRMSGPWVEALLTRAIEDAGGVTQGCGVLSTPAVSFLTTRTGAQAGIMISASHNPYRDNGIKIFSSQGTKLTDAIEASLESKILSSTLSPPIDLAAPEASTGHLPLKSIPEYCNLYTDFLLGCLPREFRLEGLRLVVDCAHGSLSSIAPRVLRKLGAELITLHCQPDGQNINLDAGALHVAKLQEAVLSNKAHLGIAFDGDADRAMFVDSGGKPRDGDDILYLLARYTDFGDATRVVVGTVMANLGLELALQDLGIPLVRAPVGDRYVLEEMLELGAILGGEQSGHVILRRLAQTGDGMLTALKVLEILKQQNANIHELCKPVKRYPQVLVNVPVRDKPPLSSIPGLQQAEAACKQALGPHSRILLRYSGTEHLARVMVEGKDATKVDEAAQRLAAIFKQDA